jgi:tRNA A-37 threonylcarbamoyl transferase component Bud32
VSSVIVARFEGRSGVVPVVRAALDVGIVYVALADPPPAGRNTLQLFVGDELVGAVLAELVGSGRDGEYPLRVRLLDPAHAAEMGRLVDRALAPSPGGPRPSRTSIREEAPEPRASFAEEEATLASRSPEASEPTLVSRAPHIDDEKTLTSALLPAPSPAEALPPSITDSVSPPEAEVVATTVFDPDSLLRARSIHTDSEDDLTIPRSPDELRAPRPRSIRESRDAFFTDDESQTLPGSTRTPGAPRTDVSWNVRIAPTTKDPLCGRTIGGGKYILDSVIGTGAIGIVFKASHKDLGRTVAIKVLNPRYRDDVDLLAVFRTEARAASQLEHPNVARVYDYGQEPDGLVYIVMEYLSGYTLGSVLAARRKLTPARAVDVMIQGCAGLSAAHDRDIVHRDVKPDNIVLVPAQDDEGRPVEIVKVCDFGIAALGAARSEEGNAAGTPEYMAPEQTTGSRVAPSADVYACGCTLYEMLTGQVPFTADQAYRILMKHRTEAPRPPSSLEPSLSPALEAVVLRCMEKAPARRYQSARELRVDLRRIADAQSSKA